MVAEPRKVPTRRNGFYYKNDKVYTSVSNILSIINKPALFYWTSIESAKIALRNPELSDKEVYLEFQAQLKDSQERGRYVHRQLELLAEGFPVDLSNTKYSGYTNALANWWDVFRPETISTEIEVYSDKYLYAGRCDYICHLKGSKWLVDAKSGSRLYKEVGLQNTAYKHALKESEIIDVDHTGALLLRSDGSYSFRETKDRLEDFLNVYEVWKWNKRKGD